MTAPDGPPARRSWASPQRWREVRGLAEEVLARPPEARAAYLDDACDGDAPLRAEVESQVEACERVARSGAFLQEPALAFAAPLFNGQTVDVQAEDIESVGKSQPFRHAEAALRTALAERYDIARELGRGGTATVYLARDHRHGRMVALKVLDSTLGAELSAERFLREIRVTAGMTHPHVLPLHDSGEAAGQLYYVMPYVDGETLKERLRHEKRLSVDNAVRLVREVASALDYAHRHGIVHRDVKPANILLVDGHAVVADFGIARAVGRARALAAPDDAHAIRSHAGGGSETLTTAGTSPGTPAYMAPEQATNGAAVDHRTDLYALGVVAYEVLAGAHPFGARSPGELLAAHCSEAPPPLDAHRPEVPATLSGLVMRLLAKDPLDRPQQAAEVLRALDGVDGGRDSAHRSAVARRRAARAAAAGLLIAVGVGGYTMWRPLTGEEFASRAERADEPAATRPSLAVLPFRNLSREAADGPFADALTDELIGALGKVRGLRTAGRASAFSLKGAPLDPRAAAKRLGVGAVLEGTVRTSGDRVEVGAELVRAIDGAVLWRGTYDRGRLEIFAVQEEIARAIVGALRLRHDATSEPRVRRATADAAAYEFYLKGQYDWREHPGSGTGESVRYFQQAIAHDPNYAAAYAGLADAYTRMAIFGNAPPRETFAKAETASVRALALDSTLAAAHASLGQVRMVSEYAWTDADREYRQAMDLDPTYLFARELYSISLASRGRYAAAMAQLDTVRAIDPLELLNAHYPGRLLLSAGRPDDAIHLLSQLVELEPQASQGYQQLGHAYLAKGMTREAITAFRRAALLSGSRDSAQLAYAYAVTGRRTEARQVLQALLTRSHIAAPPYSIAMAYAGLGDRDAAFRWLDLGYAQRAPYMYWLGAEPGFASLHADPRWPALLRRLGVAP